MAGKVAGGQRRGFGTGQALAIVLARSGAYLAISDIDTEGRAATGAPHDHRRAGQGWPRGE